MDATELSSLRQSASSADMTFLDSVIVRVQLELSGQRSDPQIAQIAQIECRESFFADGLLGIYR